VAVACQGGAARLISRSCVRARPDTLQNLNEVAELRGWGRDNGTLRLGSGLTYSEAMGAGVAKVLPALAEAARTVGSPQIRNRGTLGGNLGTASPAGDALPPLLVYEAEVVVASAERGIRVVPVVRFLTGPKQNALFPDELIVAVRLEPREMRQTFMKVGPRNAMVIAVVSLCLAVDREAGEIRVSYGSAGPKPGLVRVALDQADELVEMVARDASPIDDVRGTADYRVHALKVLTGRALNRCLT
jgi:CO/xanthine dehydrogenase FAD-binding subunit